MDYTNIPSCALFRHGTVIVRLKMEVPCSCARPTVWPAQGYKEAVPRLSKCEQCSRTRLNSQYSDCDSDVVGKCRPYRASVARRRYINVCAAVCLLLLVGGLPKLSSASPCGSRRMDRVRRSSDQENPIWGNPCKYPTMPTHEYSSQLAKSVANTARNKLHKAEEYKDTFAKNMHSFKDFKTLLDHWNGYEFLYSWKSEEIVRLNKMYEKNGSEADLSREDLESPNKVYGTNVSDMYLDNLMSKIDEILPKILKTMKIVMAGLHFVSKEFPDKDIRESDLRRHLEDMSLDMQSVACTIYDVLIARGLPILPLQDSEILERNFTFNERYQDSVIVYRDALNYLEYVEQVFEKMSEVVLK